MQAAPIGASAGGARGILEVVRSRLVVGATLLATWIAHDAQAEPADRDAARRLFAEAERDEREGRWADARAKLLDVAAWKETFGVRYHLAHCEERLGMTASAVASYRRAAALAEGLPPRERDDGRTRAEAAVARLLPRVPRLVLRAPDGATVFIDGRAVTPDGVEGVPVDPGEHGVRAERGADEVVTRVRVLEGERREVTLAFSPSLPLGSSAPALDRGARSPRGASSAAPWIVGGAGAALLLTSGYLGYRWHRLRGETDAACATNPRCDPRREDVISTYRAWTLGAGVLGAAGLGVGLALGARAPTVSGRGAALDVRGRF